MTESPLKSWHNIQSTPTLNKINYLKSRFSPKTIKKFKHEPLHRGEMRNTNKNENEAW